MAISEFELIKKYFTSFDGGEGISLGIGDDCALINVPSDYELAITTDTQNEGIHFFPGTDPFYLGYKSLLVNVSDLAAMGAKPYCFTLSINLPDANDEFLKKFSKGLFTLAKTLNLPLIGGNTTKGPLSITISAYGLVKKGQALCRNNAKEGDGIYVTGSLGLPGFAVDLGYKSENTISLLNSLSLFKDYQSIFFHCYEKSMLIENRCAFGVALSEISACAIDISDGIIGDLRHITEASKCGCVINVESLPKPVEFNEYGLPEEYQDKLCLFGGGDYELLFTVSEKNSHHIKALSERYSVPVSRVCTIKNGAFEILKHGKIYHQNQKSFEHFYN